MAGKRGPNISDKVEHIIFHWATKVYPDEPRASLALRLRQKIAELGWVVPTEQTIKKRISECRHRELNPEDSPWSLDALRDNPLSPETLPVVFEVWLLKQEDLFHPSLTVREAKWASRLSAMSEDIERIRIVAELCAEWEIIADLTNKPQLSSAPMMLHIYQLMTGFKIEKERQQAILRRKQTFPKSHERIEADLKAIYGEAIIADSNELRTRTTKGGTNERPHNQKR